jgi:hypothetical protein
MLAINEVLYYWLTTSTSEEGTIWRVANQLTTPPKPQDATSFGFYRISSIKNYGDQSFFDTYNPTNDNLDRAMQNWCELRVTIDILGKDERFSDSDAANLICKIQAYMQDEDVREKFYSANIGYLRHDQMINLSSIESGQGRIRYTVDYYFNMVIQFNSTVGLAETFPVNVEILN